MPEPRYVNRRRVHGSTRAGISEVDPTPLVGGRLEKLYELRDRIDAEIEQEEAKRERAQRVWEIRQRVLAKAASSEHRKEARKPDAKARRRRIREWARENGMDVGKVGRIPKDVVDAYDRLHPGDPPDGSD